MYAAAVNWEELARREPYFAVLRDDGSEGVHGNAEPTAAFFESGEEDVAALLAAIASLLGRELIIDRALDFGCGAGRLTLPLARRARRVVGCDIAPTMLAHAGRNAETAELCNVTFTSCDDLPGAFDFICSLLVFQYIPIADGYAIVRSLVHLLAPGGIAAIQLAEYDEHRLRGEVEAAGAHLIARFPTGQGEVLIIEKPGRSW